MNSRRHFLTSLATVGAATIAGCGGNDDTGTPTDTISESPTPEDVVPTPTPRPGTTETPIQTTSTPDQTTATPDQTTPTETTPTPTPTETPTPTPTPTPEPDRDLSGEEIYLNWIHGEDGQILEQVQGENGRHSISFQSIDEALEEGFQTGGRNEAVANALKTASQDYYTPDDNYEQRHRHILSALHQTLEQKPGLKWNFNIDSRLDAQPSDQGGMKYSRVDVETDETTENGNKKHDPIRGVLTESRDHTVHYPGKELNNPTYIEKVLQQTGNPETYLSRSLVDKDALDNALDNSNWDRERSYDQFGMGIGILIGGGIRFGEYEDNYIAPNHLLVSEDGREEEILQIVDDYEEAGDMELRNQLREHYFNNGHDQYEASEVNITVDDSGSLTDESITMEKIEDFSMAEEIADA
jgi:hypothetical protein